MFRSPISPASFCTSACSSSRSAISSGDSAAILEIFLPDILIPNHQSNAKTAATPMVMHKALKKMRTNTQPHYSWKFVTGKFLRVSSGERTRLACCFRRRAENLRDSSRTTRVPRQSLTFSRTDAVRPAAERCTPAACAPPIASRSRDLGSKPRCAESEEQSRHHNENGKLRPVFEEICSAQNDRAHECDEIGCRKQCAESIKKPRHGFSWKNETGKEDARQQEHHRHLQRLHLVLGLGSDHQAKTEQGEYVH